MVIQWSQRFSKFAVVCRLDFLFDNCTVSQASLCCCSGRNASASPLHPFRVPHAILWLVPAVNSQYAVGPSRRMSGRRSDCDPFEYSRFTWTVFMPSDLSPKKNSSSLSRIRHSRKDGR